MATLETRLTVSYTKKQILPYNPTIALLGTWYLPKGFENVCLHKNLNTDVYDSFVHN